MKDWIYAGVILVASMPVGHAEDPWLCIGEQIAFITNSKTAVFESEAGVNSQKFLITGEGLKLFGDEGVMLQECFWSDDGSPSLCRHPDEFVFDYFRMSTNGIFTLYRLTGSQDENNGELEMTDHIIKGKCSKL